MTTNVKNFLARHADKIETFKLFLLITGIAAGIIRDLTTVDSNEMYQLHEKFASESVEVAVDSPLFTIYDSEN